MGKKITPDLGQNKIDQVQASMNQCDPSRVVYNSFSKLHPYIVKLAWVLERNDKDHESKKCQSATRDDNRS